MSIYNSYGNHDPNFKSGLIKPERKIRPRQTSENRANLRLTGNSHFIGSHTLLAAVESWNKSSLASPSPVLLDYHKLPLPIIPAPLNPLLHQSLCSSLTNHPSDHPTLSRSGHIHQILLRPRNKQREPRLICPIVSPYPFTTLPPHSHPFSTALTLPIHLTMIRHKIPHTVKPRMPPTNRNTLPPSLHSRRISPLPAHLQ